ncbi:hypothetical protein MG293_020818 [Ovis ammon polii]|uniref:Ribosome production factor 2 homolog n=1 Tax=Ovis ammon polii TaxID=230172 RepID=A0AAD4TMZ1_OVIAM|nr:hypothetical protein MG293_020818 [Ovis ammon polii]
MEDADVVVYQEQEQVSSEEQGQEHPRPGAPSDRLALEALVALQLELDPVNKKAQRAHARLKHKNCQRRRVHLEHRSAIIQGIPGFWVEVRSQSQLSLAPGTLQRKGLSGIQFFSEKLSEFGGEVVMRYQASCSTPVQWYQGFERKAYGRRHHDSSVNFFNWFFDHNFSGSDWIAEIKDLWPNPLQYYVKRKAPPQEVLEGQEIDHVLFPPQSPPFHNHQCPLPDRKGRTFLHYLHPKHGGLLAWCSTWGLHHLCCPLRADRSIALPIALDTGNITLEVIIPRSEKKCTNGPEPLKPKQGRNPYFRGPTVSNIRLAGLEYVLHFTALNGKIYFRSYKLLLKKSGCRTPRIELEEMGPSLDLVLRRTHLASDDLYKLSIKMPKALKPKKKKNIS